jgi:predicted dehydrogenase
MTAATRFGILSFAHYHANFWAAAMNESDEAVLAGIWDDDRARGEQAAETYGAPYYDDLDALLAECDAVGITSETSKHAELVEAAAAASVHVLLEKPMATTLEECRRIRDAVRQHDILFMQNFPKRFDPINQELLQLVQSGKLGQITMVRVRHGNSHLLEMGDEAAEAWYAQPALSGGGALIDEGVHAADLLVWLLGLPQEAAAYTAGSALGLPAEDTVLAIYRYQSGVLAEIASSSAFVAAGESVQIYGTGGSVILSGVDLGSRDFSHEPYLKYYSSDGEPGQWQGSDTVPFFKYGKQDFHKQGPLHFLACLRQGKEPVIGIDDAWKSMAMVEAAYRAAESGQSQPVLHSLDQL